MNKITDVLTLASLLILLQRCQSLPVHSNNLPTQSPTKNVKPNVQSQVDQISAAQAIAALPQNVWSNYYNLMANQPQKINSPMSDKWHDQGSFPQLGPIIVPDEYGGGDNEYYEDMDERNKLDNAEIYMGNPSYQPDGWFEGPMFSDESESVQNDEFIDPDLANLVMKYFYDQLAKYNEEKQKSELKETESSQVLVKTTPATTTSSTAYPLKPTSTSTTIPKKLYSNQAKFFHRGQKEYPMLRPAADSNDRNSRNQISQEWPNELDEQKISEEESLMSLKQKRAARDVLTAQLDKLKTRHD